MNSEKIIISILILTIGLSYSCNTKSKKSDEKKLTEIKSVLTKTDSISASLFNQKCMICHNHVGKVDSTMIAPPFFAVKKHYLRASEDKEEFVEIMSDWVKNPSEDNLLMSGTMDSFEIMPYLAYTEEDIVKIVNYVYENDMEKPEWFDAHQASHRKEGRGGMGNGKGNRQNKRD